MAGAGRSKSGLLQDSSSGTAVAIDKDKNSQHAVKWALENMPNKSRKIILVHVLVQQQPDSVPKEGRPPTDDETRNLFLPFRGFCARKRVVAKELVLVGQDVPSALAEYICACSISSIVLGASSRSMLTRAFRNIDAPTSLGKSVPDFCSVYAVSSRGRVQNIRLATRAPTLATVNRQSSRSSQVSQLMSYPDTPSSADSNLGISRSSMSSNGADSSQVSQWETISSSSSSSSNSAGNLSNFNDNTRISRQLGSRNMSSQQFKANNSGNKIPSAGNPAKNIPPSHYNQLNYLNLRGQRDSSFISATESEISGPTNYSSNIFSEQSERTSTSSGSGNSNYSGIGGEEDEELRRMREELKRTLDELRRLEDYKLTQESAMDGKAEDIAQSIAELEHQKQKQKEIQASAGNEVRCKRYKIEEIEVATNYFSLSEKIGEGGYGPVFKAIMDRTAVAVKVLRPDISQGQQQFQREVEILSLIKHPNMVLLIGACPEYGCLVYEYMENGSLADRLSCKDDTPPIPLGKRFKIAAEIASALNFLHHLKPAPLVHRDLKPGNILLDRNYVSKISDVGLAKLVPPSVADSVTQYQVTAAAGTFCYIDPEYQQTGKLSTKSDIYSLGVLLLQIITARPPIGLAHDVERAIEKGNFADILDPAVSGWPVQDALSYAELALKCCELRGRDRPDLGSVILPELERLRAQFEDSS